MYLQLSHGKGQRICAVELESGGILEVRKGAVPPIMVGPVPVHAPSPHDLGVAVLGQGRTLLLQDGEMTTQLPHGEGSLIVQNLLSVIQKKMKKASGDPILLLAGMVTNVMLIMIMRRGRPHLTVMDLLHAGGHPPGHPQDRPQDPAPGPLTRPLLAATDR